MRKQYLQEHHPAVYSRLILSEELHPHLIEIDRAAYQRLECIVPQLAKTAGVTEQLKAANQLQWVGMMNVIKAQAEEIILAELVYSN